MEKNYVSGTTSLLFKIGKEELLEYRLLDEHIKDSYFSSAKCFPSKDNVLELADADGKVIDDKETLEIILTPLTCKNDTDFINFFIILSTDTLNALYMYYEYFQINNHIKRRVCHHFIAQWILNIAIQNNFTEMQQNKIQKFYEENYWKNMPWETAFFLNPYDCYLEENFSLFKEHFKENPSFVLKLPTKEKQEQSALYTILEPLTFVHDQSQFDFFKTQSLDELYNLYNYYDTFRISQTVKKRIGLFYLLKWISDNALSKKQFKEYVHKKCMTDYYQNNFSTCSTESIVAQLNNTSNEAQKKILNQQTFEILFRLIYQFSKKNIKDTDSFEFLFFEHLFVSEGKKIDFTYVKHVDDIFTMLNIFSVKKSLLEKIEELKIYVSDPLHIKRLDSNRVGSIPFNKLRRALPALNSIVLMGCNELEYNSYSYKKFIKSVFYHKIKDINQNGYQSVIDTLFNPLTIYIDPTMPEESKQILLCYKKTIITSAIKNFLEFFCGGAIVCGVVGLAAGAFVAPIWHLIFCESSSYDKNSLLLHASLILMNIYPFIYEFVLKNNYSNDEFRYHFNALAIPFLVAFYCYHAKYGNDLFIADLHNTLLYPFGFLFLIGSLGFAGAGVAHGVKEHRDTFLQFLRILRYKQTIFLLPENAVR